jgi:hypothetical protein
LDFTVTKTSKGGYADYSTSKWSRKETALTAQEQAAIDTNGLYNLSDFLPKRPGDVELKVIKEMFEASVDGQAYDPDRWSQYFKPSGFTGGKSSDDAAESAAPAAVAKAAPAAPFVPTVSPDLEDDEPPAATAPVQTSAAKPSSQKAEDILAMIRNRSKQ